MDLGLIISWQGYNVIIPESCYYMEARAMTDTRSTTDIGVRELIQTY